MKLPKYYNGPFLQKMLSETHTTEIQTLDHRASSHTLLSRTPGIIFAIT